MADCDRYMQYFLFFNPPGWVLVFRFDGGMVSSFPEETASTKNRSKITRLPGVDPRGAFWHNKTFYIPYSANRGRRHKEPYVSCSERKRELRRRRHRKKKLSIFSRKLQKSTVSERTIIADKIRALTPGGEVIVANWDLDKR